MAGISVTDTEGEEVKDRIRTIKGLIKGMLKKFLPIPQKKDIRELRGKIEFREDYDYKKMRKGRLQ
jgi:hypothetical protein